MRCFVIQVHLLFTSPNARWDFCTLHLQIMLILPDTLSRTALVQRALFADTRFPYFQCLSGKRPPTQIAGARPEATLWHHHACCLAPPPTTIWTTSATSAPSTHPCRLWGACRLSRTPGSRRRPTAACTARPALSPRTLARPPSSASGRSSARTGCAGTPPSPTPTAVDASGEHPRSIYLVLQIESFRSICPSQIIMPHIIKYHIFTIFRWEAFLTSPSHNPGYRNRLWSAPDLKQRLNFISILLWISYCVFTEEGRLTGFRR